MTESTAARIADALARIALAMEAQLGLDRRDRQRESWRKLDELSRRQTEASGSLRVVK